VHEHPINNAIRRAPPSTSHEDELDHSLDHDEVDGGAMLVASGR
jgi:hypothetical protein